MEASVWDKCDKKKKITNNKNNEPPKRIHTGFLILYKLLKKCTYKFSENLL